MAGHKPQAVNLLPTRIGPVNPDCCQSRLSHSVTFQLERAMPAAALTGAYPPHSLSSHHLESGLVRYFGRERALFSGPLYGNCFVGRQSSACFAR